MFHEDGTMRKSYESDLGKQFENEVDVLAFMCSNVLNFDFEIGL
jgi:hypothetical protein